MRTQLREAFENRGGRAPDPIAVLGGVRAGIERRGVRRRRLRLGGTAIAVVLTAAATVLTVNAGRTGDQPAATSGPGPDQPPSVERISTLRVGWVPDDLGPPVITSTQIKEQVSYPNRPGNHRYLGVSVDHVEWTPNLDLPTWQRIEVNGRPGREQSDGGHTSQVLFQLPSGRWATVTRSDTSVNGADESVLRQEALRVAESVSESGDSPLRVGFVPTYLPQSQRVIGVEINTVAQPGLGAIVSAAGTLRFKEILEYATGAGHRPGQMVVADEGSGLIIYLDPGTAEVPENPPYSGRISDIQGRPAYQVNNGTEVRVSNFHGGRLRVVATAGHPVLKGYWPLLPLAELIKVAEGVRWVG